MRRATISAYTSPATPPILSASLAPESAGHGALTAAEMNKTVEKWTTVGEANAFIPLSPACVFIPAPRVITTNCRPIRTAAEEPMMTEKLPQAASGDKAACSIVDSFTTLNIGHCSIHTTMRAVQKNAAPLTKDGSRAYSSCSVYLMHDGYTES